MKTSTSISGATFNGHPVRTLMGHCAVIMALVCAATCSAVPANDDFNNATVIRGVPYTNTIDVSTATTATDDPYYCFYPYNSVWYALTPTQNVVVTASTAGSSYDTTLTAFSGVRGSLYELACDDDFGGTLQSQVSFFAQAGVAYHFLVAAWMPPAGTLVFSVQAVPAPRNDSFTNATSIASLPYTNSVNTVGATTGPEDYYYCYYPQNTVWYSLHASQSGLVAVSTAGSDYTTTLQVFTGAPGKFSEVGCGTTFATFSAVAGQTYYFQIGSYNGYGGNLLLSVNQLVAPPNDSFTNAIPITALPYTNTENTAGATVGSEDAYYCYYPYNTVWYSLTPTQSGRFTASTLESGYAADISVLRGKPGSFTTVVCGFSEATFDATAGQTYYYVVGAYYYGTASNLVFSVSEILPPPNDEFNNATAITSLPSTNTVDTELATRATDDPVDCSGLYGPTAWYVLTPTDDEFVQLTVLPSPVYGVVGVYTGFRDALQNVTCVGSGGQAGFAALAGHTYYLMVGTQTGGGNFSFALNAFPLLKVAVTVDANSPVDSKTGLATISGTVSSSAPVTIGLAGTVRQKLGRKYLVSTTFGESPEPPVVVQCPGQATWSVQVLGDNGNFGSGTALVLVGAGAYDPASGQSAAAQNTATVQLRGK